MLNTFDITDFGAVADGKTDCTAAIQAAFDAAGKVQGTVIIPPAEFLCGYVKLPAYVTVKGTYSWDFKGYGGSILKLNRTDVPCLLDITGAFGCCISGLCINGDDLGSGIHGVYLSWEDRWEGRKTLGGAEDTPTITDCRIGNFSGNAVHYHNVWCCSIRHSMLCYSENGLSILGCDTFILDCWFSCNRKSGITSRRFMSGTVSGCRLECNKGHGIDMYDAGVMQFNNNYFDANGQCGFYCADPGEDFRGNLVFTGNIFYRDGQVPEGKTIPDAYNAHIHIAHATNVLIDGNDFAGGEAFSVYGPKHSLIIQQLKSSVIKNNVMQNGALGQNIVDLGGHKGEVLIKDNAGAGISMPAGEKFWPRFDD